MSNPAATFRRFRDANDPAGDLGWSSKMARKGLKAGAAAPPDLELAFALNDDERVLWRLLKLPRKYLDLENCGVVATADARSFYRALVSADVVDVVEPDETKPIVPIEIVRLKKAVAGQAPTKSAASTTLKPRVYRPDITTPPTASTSSSGGTEPPKPTSAQPPPKAAAKPAPKPEPKPVPQPVEVPVAPLGSDEKALGEEIERRHTAMATQNHYQFLEVQPSAPAEGIRAAYMRLAKTFHPDRMAGLVRDERAAKKGDALFKRLQDAWSTLNDPGRRAQYDKTLGSGGAPSSSGGSGGKVRRTDEARVATLKADHLVKTKQIKEAEGQYKAALLLDDQYAPALLGLAWAIFLNEARDKTERIAEAKKRLLEVADMRRQADAHYKLALIARIEGNEAEHERRIALAAKTDPRHQEAMQELRLLRRRKESAQDKAGGLFSKLRR